MVTALREADEQSLPEVAKKHGVSAQTIYASGSITESSRPEGDLAKKS